MHTVLTRTKLLLYVGLHCFFKNICPKNINVNDVDYDAHVYYLAAFILQGNIFVFKT